MDGNQELRQVAIVGTTEIWVKDNTSDLDTTLADLAEGVALLPQWYIERHGGHLVRVKDVLAMFRLYKDTR